MGVVLQPEWTVEAAYVHNDPLSGGWRTVVLVFDNSQFKYHVGWTTARNGYLNLTDPIGSEKQARLTYGNWVLFHMFYGHESKSPALTFDLANEHDLVKETS